MAKSITSPGQIIDGDFVPSFPDIRKKQLAGRDDGEWVTEIIRPIAKPKTSQQLGYYYAVILPTVHKQLLDNGIECYGIPVTEDQADAVLKYYCNNDKPKGLMTLEEASEFIDTTIRWAALKLGCVIPPPDIKWREHKENKQ